MKNSLLLILSFLVCSLGFSQPESCPDFRIYYSHLVNSTSGSTIYSVDLSSGNAELTAVTNRDYEIHISYDTDLDLLYAVNANGSAIEVIDPNNPDPGASVLIPLEAGLSRVLCNVYYNGIVYLGDANLDIIVEVDLNDGSWTQVASGINIEGGDLVVQNDELYLATRIGNLLYQIDTNAGTGVAVGNIPVNVNGIGLSADNAFLMSNFNSFEFFKLDSDGSVLESYPALLDGNPFQLLNGDLTSDCFEGDNSIECEGVWRTQTQGGWGAPANGNNPGVYRDANFDSAFPDGLTIGCADGNTLTFETAGAIESFLPSGGSPSVLANGDVVYTGNGGGGNGNGNGGGNGNGNGNGGGNGNSSYGSFAGNLTALALSLGFDAYDADFAPGSDYSLADLYIQSGAFAGYTVGELFELANDVIGGCNTDFSPSALNSAVDAINNSYVDGVDANTNYLACEAPAEEPDVPETDASENDILMVYPNPAVDVMTIVLDSESDGLVRGQIFSLSGVVVKEVTPQPAKAGQKLVLTIDVNDLQSGYYVLKVQDGKKIHTQPISVNNN